MEAKQYRLKECFRSADRRSLIVDASAGLSLGVLPGLNPFQTAVAPIREIADGIVVSPGQMRVFSGRRKTDAALLVRADWTNALRKEGFVLQPEKISHILLLTPQQALDLGASALVVYLLLGYEETVEVSCLETAVQLAIEGSRIGLPLIVDVLPSGSRVVLASKAVELGVSFALESGADGVAVPWPGEDSFARVMTMAAEAPVWLKPATTDQAQLAQALNQGASGVWTDEHFLEQDDPATELRYFAKALHADSLEAA